MRDLAAFADVVSGYTSSTLADHRQTGTSDEETRQTSSCCTCRRRAAKRRAASRRGPWRRTRCRDKMQPDKQIGLPSALKNPRAVHFCRIGIRVGERHPGGRKYSDRYKGEGKERHCQARQFIQGCFHLLTVNRQRFPWRGLRPQPNVNRVQGFRSQGFLIG